MSASYSYTQIKAALTAAGYTPSEGPNWLATDQGMWDQFVISEAYGKGAPDLYGANYGIAYSAAPAWLAEVVTSGTPSSTPSSN